MTVGFGAGKVGGAGGPTAERRTKPAERQNYVKSQPAKQQSCLAKGKRKVGGKAGGKAGARGQAPQIV